MKLCHKIEIPVQWLHPLEAALEDRLRLKGIILVPSSFKHRRQIYPEGSNR